MPIWQVQATAGCDADLHTYSFLRDVSAFEAFLSVSDLFYYDSCDVM
ncbi:hypothetical protein Tsp_00462 [Trichinella spiralis]|nr:hypothetical protein Tsp_00462 [Trichinella spiralis]